MKRYLLITNQGNKVCQFLNISKFTLYNYLDTIRGDKEDKKEWKSIKKWKTYGVSFAVLNAAKLILMSSVINYYRTKILTEGENNHMNHPQKILFTDLDGTLLDDNKKITPENSAAIAGALKKGHKIVVSTGRPLGRRLPVIQSLAWNKRMLCHHL